MTLSRRAVAAGALLAMTAVGARAAAPDARAIPAKKLFPFLDLYLSLPPGERSRFAMAYYLSQDGRPGTSARFFLVSGAGRTPLPVAADGRLLRHPTLAELNGDAVIAIDNRPEHGRFSLEMELQAVAPMAETVSAADCVAAIDQCNAGIRKKAGLIGFAAPTIEQVVFVGTSSGSATLADGRTVALPAIKGSPAFRPASLPSAGTLKFPRPPQRARLAGKKG